jgi:hypothetical protein
MRVMIRDQWKFPGDFFIFDKQGTQISPDTEAGRKVISILKEQKRERIEDNKQQIKVEKYHKKDINNDGFIGDPTKEENKVKKSKKKSKYNWR